MQKSFKSHSYRSDSVSKAKVNGLLTSIILGNGRWTRNSTFKKFYYKDAINYKIQGDELNYTSSLILE